MRMFVVANPTKGDVRPALDKWLPMMGGRADVVGVDFSCEDDLGGVNADLILVLAATARSCRPPGGCGAGRSR